MRGFILGSFLLFEAVSTLGQGSYAPSTRHIDSLNRAAFHLLKTDIQRAESLSQKASHLADYLDHDPGRIDALFNLGYVQLASGALPKALERYEEGIALAIETADRHRTFRGYLNLANAQAIAGFTEEALAHREKARDIAQAMNNDSAMALALQYMAKDLFRLRRLKASTSMLDKADSIYRTKGDTLNTMLCRMDRLALLNYTGNHRALLHETVPLRAYFAKRGNDILLLNIEAHRAISFEYEQMNDSARMAYGRAFELASTLGDLREMVELSGYYAQFLDSIDAPEATKWYARSLRLKDSLYTSERTREVARWQARFETEEAKRALAEVNLRKAESDAAVARQRQWLMGLGGLVLMISGGGGFWIYRNRQREEQRKVREESRFRKKLLDTTVLAQEEERQRIAKDLHDGLVQTLAALKMGLQSFARQALLDASASHTLEERIHTLDEATAEARNLSHQMMPRALSELGLVAAIEDMLQKSLDYTGIRFRFEHFGLEGERFEKRIEVGLYRICQELINNIIKHSEARKVEVQLYKTRTHLILHVEDDGKGFTVNQESSGIGLSNIFSRASAVDGEVSYEAGSPSGTVANIRVPLA